MTYPNYKNKHLEKSLFTAHDFVKYKKMDLTKMPKDYLIIFQKDPLNHLKRKYRGKYKKIKFSSQIFIYKLGNIGIVRLNGIGSPCAVALLEELIALGGKRFISLGTAGGLQHEGVFLCSKAIRDEGTSSHYLAHEKYVYPNKELTRFLARTLEKANIEFENATTWTTDAPYRETRAEIQNYHKEGVATVEMESSALFSVAKLRKVQIASVFVVSDLLLKEWEPKFHTINLKKSLRKVLDCALDCLTK